MDTNVTNAGAPAEYVDTAAAARILGVSVSFLNKSRVVGGGPTFRKLGRSVRYSPADLHAWAAANARRSTSDEGKAA